MANEYLFYLLADALPIVEDAIDDPAYSDSGIKRIRKLARDIRSAIEELEEQESRP